MAGGHHDLRLQRDQFWQDRENLLAAQIDAEERAFDVAPFGFAQHLA